ncbi:MAG: hypothetical protein DMF51_14120 [Acidobacteria bacterium]|nr:MAG: hypothetical protein DMF51_14120 [Acidobacteriota bacterium]
MSHARVSTTLWPATGFWIGLGFASFLLPVGCGRAGEHAAGEVLHALDQGKVVGTKSTMETFGRALAAYSVDKGGYPQGASLQQATAALVPAFLPSAVTVDAWGNDFVYTSGGASFTLTSPGADGRVGTTDDIVMTDGRFTQLPSPAAP